jgi:hypothetical protein
MGNPPLGVRIMRRLRMIAGSAFVMLALGLPYAVPSPAVADPVATIVLDRDGPATVMIQSKAAVNTLNLAVASPTRMSVCNDCRGGENAQLGILTRGTEIVLRLDDGQNSFLSTDPAHAQIQQSDGTWRVTWDDAAGDRDFEDLVVTVTIPTPAPPPDQDGDGFSPPADCMDTNSTAHPGAPEVPGNGVDDDCINGDRPAKVVAVIAIEWTTSGSGVRLLRLQVHDAPPSARVAVRCHGRRCRFARGHTAADRNGRARLLPLIPHRSGTARPLKSGSRHRT